ncbi:hypothetical protein U14_03885 [Candidatus Moduliflexus flocculans]|uniref:Uncharacterized protein n=1 Tax=Candidatus Moduliflexus flocculans TaxID=1499966 RepID=A0A081BQG7_9BACT|nr:hypothetical protein U14_03885 [Candidatus Moduliflexus flocculans]
MNLTIDLTPLEIRKIGWHALTSLIGIARSLKFLLEYDKGEGDYTELRKELFKEQSVTDILNDMQKT